MRPSVPAFPMPQGAETDAELGCECLLRQPKTGSLRLHIRSGGEEWPLPWKWWGSVNQGWQVARATLGNERVSIGGGDGPGGSAYLTLDLLTRYAPDDIGLTRQVGALIAEEQAMRLLNLRQAARAVVGAGPGPEGNVTKLLSAEHAQRKHGGQQQRRDGGAHGEVHLVLRGGGGGGEGLVPGNGANPGRSGTVEGGGEVIGGGTFEGAVDALPVGAFGSGSTSKLCSTTERIFAWKAIWLSCP